MKPLILLHQQIKNLLRFYQCFIDLVFLLLYPLFFISCKSTPILQLIVAENAL